MISLQSFSFQMLSIAENVDLKSSVFEKLELMMYIYIDQILVEYYVSKVDRDAFFHYL